MSQFNVENVTKFDYKGSSSKVSEKMTIDVSMDIPHFLKTQKYSGGNGPHSTIPLSPLAVTNRKN
jgi:hypothetical protein